MKISYVQKQAIIGHISQTHAWENLFDMKHFEDDDTTDGVQKNTAFLHALPFDKDYFQERAALTSFDLIKAVKLIIAHDLDIEPEISARNLPDDSQPLQAQAIDDTKYTIAIKEKPWTDTTDYEGYDIGLPSRFRIHATDNGFNLRMNLDGREAVWAQTSLLQQAENDSIPATELISFENMPRHILYLLQNGASVKDHRGREWAFILIKSKHSAAFARQARQVAKSVYRIQGDAFCALNFDKHKTILAMLSEVLNHHSKHYRPLFPGL